MSVKELKDKIASMAREARVSYATAERALQWRERQTKEGETK